MLVAWSYADEGSTNRKQRRAVRLRGAGPMIYTHAQASAAQRRNYGASGYYHLVTSRCAAALLVFAHRARAPPTDKR